MMDNKRTYFTTGEFAKLCSINKRTLFHYDAIGLFRPAVTDEKGYRYYSYRQLEIFLIISMLKELDVPLKEMKKYLDERTPEQLLELSRQKIDEIDQKIAKLNQIRHQMEETISYINKGLHANAAQITLEEQKEEYLVRSDLIHEENTKDYSRWLLEYTTFENNALSKDTSLVGTMLSREKIESKDYDNNSYFFARTTDKSLSNAVKPKGLYAIAYHRGNYDTIGTAYDRLIAYCAENNLVIGDFSYEESLLDTVALRDETGYVTQLTLSVTRR